MTSAEIPCGTTSQRSYSFGEKPSNPPAVRFEPIGTRDIDSTPEATTTSRCPAWIAAAALKAACIEEPHCLSTDVPHTVSGQPATSDDIRATFSACSPTWLTQPICTSSISPGSRSRRPTSPFRTCAASSSARTPASAPLRRPIGVRTASTISASVIG